MASSEGHAVTLHGEFRIVKTFGNGRRQVIQIDEEHAVIPDEGESWLHSQSVVKNAQRKLCRNFDFRSSVHEGTSTCSAPGFSCRILERNRSKSISNCN